MLYVAGHFTRCLCIHRYLYMSSICTKLFVTFSPSQIQPEEVEDEQFREWLFYLSYSQNGPILNAGPPLPCPCMCTG